MKDDLPALLFASLQAAPGSPRKGDLPVVDRKSIRVLLRAAQLIQEAPSLESTLRPMFVKVGICSNHSINHVVSTLKTVLRLL